MTIYKKVMEGYVEFPEYIESRAKVREFWTRLFVGLGLDTKIINPRPEQKIRLFEVRGGGR